MSAGMGLMQAIELVQDRASKAPATAETLRLMEAARENRLLIGRGGLDGNVIRISPPLNIACRRRGSFSSAPWTRAWLRSVRRRSQERPGSLPITETITNRSPGPRKAANSKSTGCPSPAVPGVRADNQLRLRSTRTRRCGRRRCGRTTLPERRRLRRIPAG